MGDQTKQRAQDQTQMDQRQADWDKDQTKPEWKKDTDEHEWKPDQGTPDVDPGTRPAQPSGTTPLERDQRPINQSR